MEITWDTFKPRATQSIKKLSLEKDEQARICFLESAPRLVFVHPFEKIVVGSNGKPIEENDTWPDGSPRKKVKTEYAGKFRCMGREEELLKSGADPETCPACRAHIDNPNAIKPIQRRYLGHVLKYNVKANSWAPSKPFAATLLVWDLTENRFGQIKDIYDEHGALSQKDLLLGPCENKQMQKYNIQVGGDKAAWLEHQEYVQELLQEERVKDVEAVAGKMPSEYEMESKVKEIVRAYNHAYGGAESSSYESLIGSGNVEKAAAAADTSDDAEETPTSATSPVDIDAEEVDEDSETTSTDEGSIDLTGSLDDILRGMSKA